MEIDLESKGISPQRKLGIGIFVLILVMFSGPRLDSDLGKEWMVGDERPLIIAHRGASDFFPENTMASFEGAALIGVDVLEMDFQLTSDNHLITMHDDTVDRTTNGTGVVREMTLNETLALDASAKFSNSSG
ncbi:MAG: glycerophosphodiester phosphodiesterase family protein, partial [Candidatus Thalassarchaeaceae archaeon]|nr:glycerophosphodiester phosphodiesterase family protein [Candidatus Thalassarchaeaceae archaeon]